MRIIDVLAFIAYPVIVVNLVLMVWYMSSSFIFQIRNRILLTLMLFIYVVAIAWGAQQIVNLYRRYEVVFAGAEPTSTSTQFILLQIVIAIGLSGINYLLYTRQTDKFIPLPGYKRKNKEDQDADTKRGKS